LLRLQWMAGSPSSGPPSGHLLLLCYAYNG